MAKTSCQTFTIVMNSNSTVNHFKFPNLILILAAISCLSPFASSSLALMLGIGLALLFGNPYLSQTKKIAPQLLAWSVVGLGFGMNLEVIGQVGAAGLGYTFLSIFLAFVIGYSLRKILSIPHDISLLITVGTAICGGSAIAAVASVIRAKNQDVSVALITVFLLNAVALLIFPSIGHFFGFSEAQFGLWSALAIHDTSSVVGATLQYGPQALEVGTTVKLARALWIIPLALGFGYFYSKQETSDTKEKIKKPWFILGFIFAAALVTWFPSLQPLGHGIEISAKKLLILTLFFIGSNLTRESLQSVGFKPFAQGLILWVLISTLTFIAIPYGWIS